VEGAVAAREGKSELPRAPLWSQHEEANKIDAKALDHVAIWVSDRDELAAFLCRHLGMHEIERTGEFTLVGANARRGKLTLFAAEGKRVAGVLGRVVLRVDHLNRAIGELPPDLEVEHGDGIVLFEAPAGLPVGLISSSPGEVDYDIDHVVLRVPDPPATFAELAELGFSPDGARLVVGDKRVVLEEGRTETSGEPLLNHLALLVDSGRAQLEEARRRGLEVTDVRDTENTFAVFVRGPDGIQLEYVEHKPSFALT
jgi:catechol 2,3-dioxygenase-like lactoylglutathione lyase family enzyme